MHVKQGLNKLFFVMINNYKYYSNAQMDVDIVTLLVLTG